MTDPTPDTAVQIALDGLRDGRRPWTQHLVYEAVAALARAGWLHDPAEVARLRAERDDLQRLYDARDEEVNQVRMAAGADIERLRAVVEAARGALDVDPGAGPRHADADGRLEDALSALDATPAPDEVQGAYVPEWCTECRAQAYSRCEHEHPDAVVPWPVPAEDAASAELVALGQDIERGDARPPLPLWP